MNAEDYGELTEVVIRAVATELKVSEAEVRAAGSLKAEFGMDSIAAVNIAFMIEEECNLQVEIREGDVFDSVEAIVAIVKRSCPAR